MSENNSYNKASVIVVGAGAAGLAAAIALKKARPQTDIVVIDKAAELGNHSLSGAVLEAASIHRLLDLTGLNWRETDEAKDLLRAGSCGTTSFSSPGRAWRFSSPRSSSWRGS